MEAKRPYSYGTARIEMSSGFSLPKSGKKLGPCCRACGTAMTPAGYPVLGVVAYVCPTSTCLFWGLLTVAVMYPMTKKEAQAFIRVQGKARKPPTIPAAKPSQRSEHTSPRPRFR